MASGSTPRVLSSRLTLLVVGCLLALSIVAWVHTVQLSRSMSGMAMGLGEVGTLSHGSMSLSLFLVMWATMMAAMMLPSAVPMVLAHLSVIRRRGESAWPTVAFVGGYLVVWSLAGLVPFVAYLGLSALDDELAGTRTLGALAGAILIVAGGYQLTGAKQACLEKCQSPFAFLLTHDFGSGARGSLRAGIVHGGHCLGCCVGLMSILLVVGLMNLLWMAAIFLVVFVEKTWRHGLALGRVVGAALIALGAALISFPEALSRIG